MTYPGLASASTSPTHLSSGPPAGPVPSPKQVAATMSEDVFSPSGGAKLNVTLQRRDSRARPPPILIETSSPQVVNVGLPTVQTLLDQGHVNGNGNGNGHGHHGHDHDRDHDHDHDHDHGEEATDNLGELLPTTPSRRSFAGPPNGHLGLGLERPVSPSRSDVSASPNWRPLETGDMYSPPPRRPSSMHGRPPSWHRNSLEVPNFLNFPGMPPSPTSSAASELRDGRGIPLTGAPRRFEPTPTHGLHARNLSAYFPHPGAPAAPPSPTLEEAGDSLIPDSDRKAFGGPADWQFGQASPAGASDEMESPQRRGKRRGHHHKHSLSHNFFSFLDPTQTIPNLPPAVSPDIPATLLPAGAAAAADAPKPMPIEFTSPTTAALSPLPPSKKDPQTQALGWFCVIESVLGVGLWVEGQSSGWRCLTAVGYLVVFDAMGMGVNMWSKAQAGWRSVRKPYGASRKTSLLCFSQSLFLLFAAVYIAKEALETVVLGPGGHDHGGGHGHGDHSSGDERPFPYLLLALASIASLFSGAVLGNHRKLVEAAGELFLPSWYLAAVEADTFLTNPFTLSVAGTTAALLIAGLVTPTESLKGFDAAASLILTLLTGALAWPPAAAFAQILLQTAPPAASVQMKAIRGALRDVADDRRVLGLGTFRCWAIDAGKPVTSTVGPPSAPSSRAGSMHISSPSVSAFMRTTATELNNTLGLFMKGTHAGQTVTTTVQVPLVVTLVVHVHPETSDRDVLDITRSSWTKLNSAVNGRSRGEGEVSIQVKRGWEGAND